MLRHIQIHNDDNVAVALCQLEAGEQIATAQGRSVLTAERIPAGHKVALQHIACGENVVKYGCPIGHATADISPGQWVDERVLRTNLEGLAEYRYSPITPWTPPAVERQTFMGYTRKNGSVGIRNELWIIPTVGCVNGVAERLASLIRHEAKGRESIDAIVAYTHEFGCSQLGEDHENTRRILRGMVLHPNAGGVLVVGLGCENNQPEAFMDSLGDYDRGRIRLMVCQKESDELERGLEILREICTEMEADRRTEHPLSQLRVGLKCGGSDGLSGITANPLLGRFSDLLVAQGGTTVLTEVPEMFGAETLLMNRCKDEATFRDVVKLVNDFKSYFLSHHQPVSENPSPGNRAGGISTLEEKSLGCVQKSGTSPVNAVLPYGGRISETGLNLLSAPGNDLVASTALAAAGCQLVLFTTGRGTPFGTFVPTVKIATRTSLATGKPHWIDFNAGSLAEGEPMEVVAARFVDFVRKVASGLPACNERNGYRSMAFFKQGVTL